MYKSKLQELCHRNKWSLPTYSSTKDGPPHLPRFQASVLVNQGSFTTPHFHESSKESQNEAAKLALQHFSSPQPNPPASSSVSSSSPFSPPTGSSNASIVLRHSSSGKETVLEKEDEIFKNSPRCGNASGVNDEPVLGDVQHVYKSRLQIYAQKKSLSLPVYSSIREGSPHLPRFKAIVTVDEQIFESPEFCHTLKEAENAAAKVAFSSLSKDDEIQGDDCVIYKNLLQGLTQKVGMPNPVYKTTNQSHASTFTSTVEVKGVGFHGLAAKTKKQAEMSAAKVAYFSLKKRQLSSIPSSLSQNGYGEETLERSITFDLEQKLDLGDEEQEVGSAETMAKGVTLSGHHSTISPLKLNPVSEPGNSSSSGLIYELQQVRPRSTSPLKQHTGSEPGNRCSSSPGIIYNCLQVPVPVAPSPEFTTKVLGCSNLLIAKPDTDLPEPSANLMCKRVVVYPRKQDVKLSSDVTVLPISDDQWVAISLESKPIK